MMPMEGHPWSLVGSREMERRDAGHQGSTKHRGPEPPDAMPLDIQVGCVHRSGSSPGLLTLPGTPSLQIPTRFNSPVSFLLQCYLIRGASADHHQPTPPSPNVCTPPYLVSPDSTSHLSDLLYSKSLLNIVDRFLETVTLTKTTHNETDFTLG